MIQEIIKMFFEEFKEDKKRISEMQDEIGQLKSKLWGTEIALCDAFLRLYKIPLEEAEVRKAFFLSILNPFPSEEESKSRDFTANKYRLNEKAFTEKIETLMGVKK